jgi:hypothetical protein
MKTSPLQHRKLEERYWAIDEGSHFRKDVLGLPMLFDSRQYAKALWGPVKVVRVKVAVILKPRR